MARNKLYLLLLRYIISSITSRRGQGVLDTCKLARLGLRSRPICSLLVISDHFS